MKFNGFICDVCNKSYTDRFSLYSIRVKSKVFADYENISGKRKIDICKKCVDHYIMCMKSDRLKPVVPDRLELLFGAAVGTCPTCGAGVTKHTKYCTDCGQAFAWPAEEEKK